MRRRGPVVVGAVLLLLAPAPTSAAVPAEPSAPTAPLSTRVSEAEQTLDRADTQVTRAMAALTTAKAAIPQAQTRLRRAVGLQQQAQRAAESAQTQAAQAAQVLLRAEVARSAVEAEYGALRSKAGAFARSAYQSGPIAELDVLLSARDPRDFAARMVSIDHLGRSTNSTLAALATSQQTLQQREIDLTGAQEQATGRAVLAEQRSHQAQQAAADAAGARTQVLRLTAARTSALTVAQRERAGVRARLATLQAEQARVAAEARAAARSAAAKLAALAAVQRTAAQRIAAAPPGASAGQAPDRTDSKTPRNTGRDDAGNSRTPTPSTSSLPSGNNSAAGSNSAELRWPIPGAGISGRVGPRIHPVYGYRSCHTGVDIRGGTGTPILAAASGVVASVTSGGAYGLHTLIVHNGGLATFYAHQSAAAVRAGDVVSRGQVIGYVGSTGWVTGPHLHFEVHVGGVPYDPLGWFGGSRGPVRC